MSEDHQQAPTNDDRTYCTDVKGFLQLLHQPDDVFEVRSPYCKARFDRLDMLVEEEGKS
jgi:hypothetical protein